MFILFLQNRQNRGRMQTQTLRNMTSEKLFTLPESLKRFESFFKSSDAPWLWVQNIKKALASVDFSASENKKDIPAGVKIEGDVFIHPTVKLPPYAHIVGPAWIGASTEIRIGCFVRGNVIVGENCVMGNSCEYKNSMLLDNVQTPHYNYVGDSVLGNKSHLGAGVICANLRIDKKNISLRLPEGSVETGMRKLGLILGDEAEIGCNSVLQPGTILMKRAVVLSCPFGGYLEENTMAAPTTSIRKIRRLS